MPPQSKLRVHTKSTTIGIHMDIPWTTFTPYSNPISIYCRFPIGGLAQKWDVLDRAVKKNDDRSYFMEIEAELELATRTIIHSLRNLEELKR